MSFKAKRKKTPEHGRPSLFFIIALVIGLALLVWAFVTMAGKTPPPTTFGAASPLARPEFS